MITNYVSKREISFKKAVFRPLRLQPLNCNETSPFAPPWRVSMPCAVRVVFADSLVAFHAIEQQSRRYEFHHHHLCERAAVHLAYGNESTRSHNRYHQSFQYYPHNPVFFIGYWLLPWVVSHHRPRRLSSAPCSTLLNYTASVLNKIYAKTLDWTSIPSNHRGEPLPQAIV